MSETWYVWLVFRYAPHVPVGETGEVEVVGVFSSKEKAVTAARSGDGVVCLSVDDVVPAMNLSVEWIRK